MSSRKDTLYEYLFAMQARLKDDYNYYRDFNFMRSGDEIDLLEQLMAKTKLDMFNKVMNDIFFIMSNYNEPKKK